MYTLSGDNKLIPFHLRLREIALKSEEVYKYFAQDFSSRIKNCLGGLKFFV